MKKRWLVVLALTLSCIAVVLIVSWQLTSVDKLLRPPKPSGEDLLVQQAFKEYISEEHPLNNFNRDLYNTTYNYYDVDDGEKLAIVTYSTVKNTKEILISVLHKSDDGWKCLTDLNTGCNEVEYIDFLDMNNDSKKEMVIQGSVQSLLIYKRLFVYEIPADEGAAKKLYECDYDVMQITDIDSDGTYDIVKTDSVVYKNAERHKLSVIKSEGEKFKVLDSFLINESIDTVSSMKVDEKFILDSSAKMIYVDGYKNTDVSATYFYIWDNENKKISSFDENNTYSDSSMHNMSIGCDDVNDDGFIEFPREAVITDSEVISSDNSNTDITTVLWTRVDINEAADKLYHIYNNACDYTFVFDKGMELTFTYVYDTVDKIFSVYTIDKNSKRDKKVFSIYSTVENSAENEKIYEGVELNHYALFYDEAKEYGFNAEKIKDLIIFG